MQDTERELRMLVSAVDNGVCIAFAVVTAPVWLPLWLLGHLSAPTKAQIAEHIVRNSR